MHTHGDGLPASHRRPRNRRHICHSSSLLLGLGALLGGDGGLAQGALLGQGLRAALALLLQALHQQLVVLLGLSLGALQGALLLGGPSPLALQGQGGHQALDLGGLGVLLAVLLEGAAVGVHVLAHVVLLRGGEGGKASGMMSNR